MATTCAKSVRIDAPKSRPQSVGQYTDAGDHDTGLKGQGREYRDQRTGCGEVHHQADDATQEIGDRQDELAAGTVAGMHNFSKGMGTRGQLAKPQTIGIDEEDHQGTPEPIVHGSGQAVIVAGYCSTVKGCRPNPGRGHARGRDAETDLTARYHVAVDVLFLLVDKGRQKKRATVEQQ